jgi:hypothetical protein
VRECGLHEDVPDRRPGTTRPSAVGYELNVHLMMAFVGAFEIWEIPETLESNDYLTEAEADEPCEVPLDEGEALTTATSCELIPSFAIARSF